MPKPRAQLDQLYAQRFQLWRELVNQVDFVRGSVVVLHRPCTRERCPRCKSGERHPATYLSYKQNGRTRLIYLSAEVQGTARLWVKNYRQLVAVIEQIADVNRDVLRQLAPSPRARKARR
jgi:hypothetical protein